MPKERDDRIARRTFLQSAGALAAAPLLGGLPTQAYTQTAASNETPAPRATDRRRLGKLEVSSVGLGVQNMRRKYETTVPYRPEMLNIIRRAFDSGVTFFDKGRKRMGRTSASASSAKPSSRSATRSSSRPSSAGTSTSRPASGARAATASPITSSSRSKACSDGSGPTGSISSISIGLIRRSLSRTSLERSRSSWTKARCATGASRRWG